MPEIVGEPQDAGPDPIENKPAERRGTDESFPL